MRETKFRAWDKINKKMLQVIGLFWHTPIQILVDGKNTIYEIHQNNLEFMQYTGLKDKNGKEIYEGDIVKAIPLGEGEFYVDDFKKGVIAPIEWIEIDACFALQTHRSEIYTLARWQEIEISGNIYENPELLINK